MPKAAVLGVGIAVLDVINRVSDYPLEDAEVRAASRRLVRGGNCANTLDVLAQLGRRCQWVGVLARDDGAKVIEADLDRCGIDHRYAVRSPGGATPTSYIVLSAATGSRTIVHYRDLPELSAADFAHVPLDGLDWVHFEGRNPDQTRQMIARVRRERPELPLSVEIEKPRPGIETLLRGADVLIFSRAYVQSLSTQTVSEPCAALTCLAASSDAAICLLPWGAGGAYGLATGGSECAFCPAYAPTRLLDSIGAGDVFNAAVIDFLLDAGLAAAATADGLSALLARANRLAGYKCGHDGLSGLVAGATETGRI